MLSWRNTALLAALGIGMATAQPALTTVQDILYRADGTRFTGTMNIVYNSFLSGGGSNVATANLTLRIVNGSLRVQLVPTTTASAGAQYNVTYNSGGINQFTEIWAVPPSSVTMRIRDVRVSTGAVVGPAPVITLVQIPDVLDLQNELAIRPMKGVGFGIGRAAVINQAGQIDAAAGNLSSCVRVDGSSGPCGGGGGGVSGSFSDSEIPTGLVNGINAAFTLAEAPSPAASLTLFRNGLLIRQGVDYQITGNAITFFSASIPQTGDLLIADYRFADPSNPLGSLTTPQVVCSSAGISTSATALTQLGSCTIPAGLLGAGDRIEVQFHFLHTGTATGFTGEVQIGSTAVAARAAAASETLLVGHASFGVGPSTQVWDTQSWGTALSLLTAAGTSAENTGQALTISFGGLMAAMTTDTLVLRNFTVVRYPAQTNP
jgi:hypothetical protein